MKIQSKVSQAEVSEAIKVLKEAYKIGHTVQKELGTQASIERLTEVAQEHGYTVDAIRKLRQFAMLYERDDLAELCDLCREHHTALGVSFIYKLVSIRDKAKRQKIQQRLIEEHWGHSRLVRELRNSSERGHKRGRKAYLPDAIPETTIEIERAKERLAGLLKHCDSLIVNGKDALKRKPEIIKLRRQIKQLLKALEVQIVTMPLKSRS